MKSYKATNAVHRLFIILASILIFTGAIMGYSVRSAMADGDTLTVIISTDPANMDANDSGTQYHYQVTRQIYETLFVYDEDYNIKPWLCESYEYLDDLTILMHLRHGVKFHNGDEFTAHDVDFTFRRALDTATLTVGAATQLKNLDIEKCEVIDDYTYKLVTVAPVPTLIAMLENPSTGILNKRAYEEADGIFLNGAAVGTGPYKFVHYYPGDRVEMEAFEDYWVEGQPYFKNLVMRIVSDSTSRSIEAQTHGADIVYDIVPNDIAIVNATDGVSVISDLGTNTSYLLLNTSKYPTDNPKLREAIFYGVDAQIAVLISYGDFGSFANGWVCPGVVGYDETLKEKYWPTRDLDRAKAALAESGLPEGIEVEMIVNTNDRSRANMAEMFQAQLAEVGINLKINAMEASAFASYLSSGEQNLCIYGFSATAFEADRALIQMTDLSLNYSICQFGDETFQETAKASLTEIDKETRTKMYQDSIEMLMQNYVTLPLWHKELNAAVSDDLEGFQISRSYEHHYLQYVKPRK